MFPLVVGGLAAIVFFLGVASAWPPLWVERRQQRMKLVGRVQAAGGWDAVKRDCLSLAETNRWYYWRRQFDNPHPLPPSLSALKPIEVNCISSETFKSDSGNPSDRRIQESGRILNSIPSPEVPTGFNEKPDVAVVRIKLFGLHSTGGHSTPFYGIEIVSGPGKEAYQPKPVHAASGNGHTSYREIEDGVYEVY